MMDLSGLSDEEIIKGMGGNSPPPPDMSGLSDEALLQLIEAMPEQPESAPVAPPQSSFAGLSPEQRGELAAQRLGTEEPSALDVGLNAVRGAAYAAGDIPAGIDQLASRYLPMPDSWEQASQNRVAEYEGAKKSVLSKPGGTVGYVGGQVGTAFVPGTGALKAATAAEKAAALVKPIAAGTALTALKPYETEAERFQESGISAGLGAAFPAVTAGVRGIGGVIRPRVPTGKPPTGNGAGVPSPASVQPAAEPAFRPGYKVLYRGGTGTGKGRWYTDDIEHAKRFGDVHAIEVPVDIANKAHDLARREGSVHYRLPDEYKPDARFRAGVPPGAPPPGGVAPAGAGAPPPGGPPPVPPGGGFDDPFIRKLKSSPQSRKKGELLETAQRLEVYPTAGQVSEGRAKYLEDQMRKTPGSSKLADKSYRDSAESFHRALGREIGLDHMEVPYITENVLTAAKKKFTETYDEILPHIRMQRGTATTSKLVFDTNKLVAPFDDLIAPNIPESQILQLAKIKQGLDDKLANAGEISGDMLKRWKSQIDKIADDPGLNDAVAKRLATFKESLKGAFARSLDETDPALAVKLRETDRKYANYKVLQGVQTSAGTSVEGFISGEKLHNAVMKKYHGTNAAGDFGELAEIGRMFYGKLPDSGTADRILANRLLVGQTASAAGAVADLGVTAATLATGYATAKGFSHAYYRTPAYQRTMRAGRAVGSAGTKAGASGAGRTGRPEDRPKNALLH